MTPRSLRTRLVLASAGTIVAALLAFGIAAALITTHELHATLDQALRQRAVDVARLAVSAPAVLTAPGALEAPSGGRQVAVEVLDARGRIIARSVALGARLLPRDALVLRALRDGRAGYGTATIDGRQVRMYAAPIARAGGDASGGVVVVASERGDIESTAHRLEVLLAICGVVTAVLAVLVTLGLTSRGLRPLRRLTSGAREIERTADVSRRLAVPTAGDEIAELSAMLNRMLGALEGARMAERRFLADASHELRTPVTALLGNVEYAARHGATPEVLDDLRADAARLARLVDDLLVLERGAGGERPDAPVRLDALAREVAGEIGAPVVVRRADAVTVAGDRDALARAARNLIDNAMVHGPDGGAVSVEVVALDGRALLAVGDAGAGPDAAERAHVFERFWRAPEAAGRPGSGLGLAIVAAIAERHGGTVGVDGSTFTVTLPRE